MNRFINLLGTLAIVAIFFAMALWASILIPIVLGCALALFLLFLGVAAVVDVCHAIWRRIRAPPARR